MLTWPNFINAFPKSSFLVCGRGPSLQHYSQFRNQYQFCIAGNHTPAPAAPQFRFACDSALAFIKKKRHGEIINGQQLFMFACDSQWQAYLKFSQFIQVKFEAYQLQNLSDLERALPLTRNVSVGCTYLALAMGATRIGLIGVDLNHPDYENAFPSIQADFANLMTICKHEGRKIVLHSSESLLQGIPLELPEKTDGLQSWA